MQNLALALPADSLELLKDFEALAPAERARILALVRNLRALGDAVMAELQLPAISAARA